MFEFLQKLDLFLQTASNKISRLETTEFESPEWRETTAGALDKLRALLPGARNTFDALTENQKDVVNQTIADLGVLSLLESFHQTVRRGSQDKTSAHDPLKAATGEKK